MSERQTLSTITAETSPPTSVSPPQTVVGQNTLTGTSFPALPKLAMGWCDGWAVYALAEREVVRFFRQPNRLIGAIGQPLIFWVLFAAGFHSTFAFAPAGRQVSFGEYFFPGVLVLIVLFTAIFATISVIEDRQTGFLQGVLVAPVRRASLAFGKAVGGTILAVLQAALFLLLAPIAGIPITWLGALLTLLFLAILGIGLTSLGLCLAWRMDSTQGFHALMSVFLMPLWLLSGAFFPAAGATPWLALVIRCNPLSYAVAGVRQILYIGGTGATVFGEGSVSTFPGPFGCLVITIGFSVVLLGLAMRVVSRSR